MPTFDYNKFVSMARRLLEKFGTTATFTYATSESFNTTTMANTKTTSTFTGNAVVVPFNKIEMDGETIQQQDLRLVVEKTSIVPAVDNTVTWNSVDYRIMNVEIISPGQVDVVYICQLRV